MIIDGCDCELVDDGTMDTVISVDGQEHRFSQDYAAEYRDDFGALTEDGFYDLCEDILSTI